LNLNGSKIIDISVLRNVHTLNLTDIDEVPTGIQSLNNKELSIIVVPNKMKNERIKYFENTTVQNYKLELLNSSNILNCSLKYLGNIHSLNLSYCCKVSDEGIKYLGNCRKLNLYGCYDITDAGLKYLRKVEVLILDISFTKNISRDCLIELGNVFVNNGERNTNYWTPYGRKGGRILW
jgi:hypothetical protein